MFAPIIPSALTLLFISLAPAPGRCFSYMAEEDGNSVCEICECDFKRIPYFVDCSSKNIKSMLTNWNIDYPEETGHSEIMIDVGNQFKDREEYIMTSNSAVFLCVFWFGGILGLASWAEFPVSLINHVSFMPRLLYRSTHHTPESFTHLKTG